MSRAFIGCLIKATDQRPRFSTHLDCTDYMRMHTIAQSTGGCHPNALPVVRRFSMHLVPLTAAGWLGGVKVRLVCICGSIGGGVGVCRVRLCTGLCFCTGLGFESLSQFVLLRFFFSLLMSVRLCLYLHNFLCVCLYLCLQLLAVLYL